MKHPADRTPADRTTSAKRRRTSSSKQRANVDAGRVVALADLPETVLLQIFKRLGLDRLTALQGARTRLRLPQHRAPGTPADWKRSRCLFCQYSLFELLSSGCPAAVARLFWRKTVIGCLERSSAFPAGGVSNHFSVPSECSFVSYDCIARDMLKCVA